MACRGEESTRILTQMSVEFSILTYEQVRNEQVYAHGHGRWNIAVLTDNRQNETFSLVKCIRRSRMGRYDHFGLDST